MQTLLAAVWTPLERGVSRPVDRRKDSSMKERLATQLEVIFIENHPDHRASGMGANALLRWGVRMGLISQQEFDEATGIAQGE